MYIFKAWTKTKRMPCIETAVSDLRDVIGFANLYEGSPDIINFIVWSSAGPLGQQDFGVGGFTKWLMQSSGQQPWQTALIKKCEERGEFDKLDDGYYYYFPKGGGGITSSELRTIADELDRRSASWDHTVKNGLSQITAETAGQAL